MKILRYLFQKIKKHKLRTIIFLAIALPLLVIFVTMRVLYCDFWGALDYLLHPWEYEKATTEEVITTDFGDEIRIVYKHYPSTMSYAGYGRTEVRFYYKGKRFYRVYEGGTPTRIESISNDDCGKVYRIIPSSDAYFILRHDNDRLQPIPFEEVPLYDPSLSLPSLLMVLPTVL